MGCVPAHKCCCAWKMSLLCHGSELAGAEAVRLPGLLEGVWGAEHEAETQAAHTSKRAYYLWEKKKFKYELDQSFPSQRGWEGEVCLLK